MSHLTRRFIVLGLVVAALSGAGWAAPAGGVVGTGTAGSCNDSALTSALAGGGLVTFDCGGPGTITLLSAKTISATTTIQGGGMITLTGNSNTRLFNVNSGIGLTLRDIILDRARSSGSDGGAISNHGRLVLENSTIQFSHADLGHSGGAIFTDGPLTITNSTLFQNDAGSAGALFDNLANSEVTLVDTRLISNNTNSGATGYGGAIWVGPQARLSLTGGQVTSNTGLSGGGFYVSPDGQLTITGASRVPVSGNTALQDGGAIYNQVGTLNFMRVDFVGNRATAGIGKGGAVASYGSLVADDDLFAGNQAYDGGGLLVTIPMGKGGFFPTATIAHSTFLSNTALNLGGGLEVWGAGMVVTVTDSAFTGNAAPNADGGGLFRVDADLAVSRSSFTHNSANNGGGLASEASGAPGSGPYVTVRDTTFSANTATTTGGGVYNANRLSLSSVTLKDNSSGFFNLNDIGVNGRLGSTVLQNSFPNCLGRAPSDDANNFATDLSCSFSQNTSQQGDLLNPLLGPLTRDPGGISAYHLPLPGSPLINHGSLNCSPTDQRGIPRANACDIGAVEFGGLLPRLWLSLIRK